MCTYNMSYIRLISYDHYFYYSGAAINGRFLKKNPV